MNPTNPKTILITIDVEDWFQVENLRPWFPPSTWDTYPLRIEHNIHRLLDLFDRFSPVSVTATFFILGWVAKRLPHLVREIQQRGHEVASHGFGHAMCNRMRPDDLAKDLVNSRQLLEEITGTAIKGYRAPNFSVNDQVLQAIRSAGYAYDSSYNNFGMHGRYGRIALNGQPRKGIAVQMADHFYEIPISNLEIGGKIIPWGGGGYFRFFPSWLFRSGVRRLLHQRDAYMFYLHPWEIDPDQPRAEAATGLSGWRHYLNLDKTYHRLEKMIQTFKHGHFSTCRHYLETVNR